MYSKMKLSVTIITLNESHNIERCLQSVSFAQELIVVDSGSTDNTVALAQKYGAKVYQHPFKSYGDQKNYAASLTSGDWILNLDADEEVSAELKENILKVIVDPQAPTLFTINRLTQFCGKWIYHGGWHPDYIVRLCRKNAATWSTPHVHEKLSAFKPTIIKNLKGPLYHYSFPSVASQLKTNFTYACLGSRELLKKKRPTLISVFLRPFLKFLECFVWKRGFLDGERGLIIALNASHSQFMKYSIAYFDKNSCTLESKAKISSGST